jgi:hypothetical protein
MLRDERHLSNGPLFPNPILHRHALTPHPRSRPPRNIAESPYWLATGPDVSLFPAQSIFPPANPSLGTGGGSEREKEIRQTGWKAGP